MLEFCELTASRTNVDQRRRSYGCSTVTIPPAPATGRGTLSVWMCTSFLCVCAFLPSEEVSWGRPSQMISWTGCRAERTSEVIAEVEYLACVQTLKLLAKWCNRVTAHSSLSEGSWQVVNVEDLKSRRSNVSDRRRYIRIAIRKVHLSPGVHGHLSKGQNMTGVVWKQSGLRIVKVCRPTCFRYSVICTLQIKSNQIIVSKSILGWRK